MAKRMSAGVKRFQTDLKAFSDLLGLRLDTVVKKVAVDCFRGVVMRTPVDTGRARSSWQIARGKPDLRVEPPPRKKRYRWEPGKKRRKGGARASVGKVTSAVLSKAQAFLSQKGKPFDKVFITNNLEYIEYLENGSSDQAPSGMVKVTLAETQAYLEKAVKEAEAES